MLLFQSNVGLNMMKNGILSGKVSNPVVCSDIVRQAEAVAPHGEHTFIARQARYSLP